MKNRPLSPPFLRRQAGVSRPLLLTALVLALGGGGAWWWTQRADSSGAAGQVGPAGTASAAAGSASGAGGGGGGRRFAGANRVQPVSVQAARKQDIRVLLSAIGNISALNTAVVRARVDGELKAIRFKEGQQVRAGQVLAEIDPRAFEIALAQAQGQLARDQAQLRNAQIDLERYKELLAKDSIAKQQVDTQEALTRQLAGTVQTDQAQVDNAKLQLSYTKVTAPISGRLGLKQADLGNIIRASDAAGIVSINQTQPISVVFAVPESNLPAITAKLRANQPMVVEAWDREQKVKLATGKVSTTDNAIDAVTGTIKLKAEFANADGTLFPNQFVNIRVQVDNLAGALTVPTSAVQRGAQGTFVYVVKDDGSVTIRRIRLGTTEGDWVSVQGDIAPGERVVTDGADRLREGAKVEVIAAAPRPGGPGGAGGGGRRDAVGPQQGASAAAGSVTPSARPEGVTGGRRSAEPAAAGQGSAPATAPGPADKAAAGARPGAPAGGAGKASSAWIDQLPPEAAERVRRTMERLPPEEAQKVNAMSPDERRAFFQKLRERRQQQMGGQ